MTSSESLGVGDAESIRVPLINVEHLTRVIGSTSNKTVILNDISFTVPTHSLFAINGPSGSGKSTTLNMLTGIDRPSSGRILFAGQELRALSEDALARWRGRHVGIIFQFFQLIPTLTFSERFPYSPDGYRPIAAHHRCTANIAERGARRSDRSRDRYDSTR